MDREVLRRTLDYLIVDNALFTYRELGYQDALPERRGVGRLRPEIHANWLRPAERVRAALVEVLGS